MTKYKFTINKDYENLTGFVEEVPSNFTTLGEYVYIGRNQIKKVLFENTQFNIKRYRKPILFNRIVYSFFRKPKAYKAYYNALLVLEKGLSTPEPVALIEEYKNKLINFSYFISLQLENVEEIRNLYFSKLETSEEKEILKAFAIYSAHMHNQGILHKDYSPGNILYSLQEDGSYVFYIVDINRMQFIDIDMKTGCQNFARLFEHDCIYEYIAPFYAQYRGYDIEYCKKLLVDEKTKFHAKKYRKKKLKSLFRF